MPFNLIKKYNDLLDIMGLSEAQRIESLRRIFNRDIQNNPILPLMASQYFQHQRRMAWLPWKIYSII